MNVLVDSNVLLDVLTEDPQWSAWSGEALAECAEDAKNHGAYVKCVTKLTTGWQKDGLLTGAQKGAIVSCAAKSSLP